MIIRKIGGRRNAAVTAPLLYDLALEFDGTNGATTFPDTSGNNLATAAAGNAQISTSGPKYGTGSLLLDGTGDWVTMSGVTGLCAFGTGPGTVAFWLKPNDVSNTQIFFDTRASGGGANQSAITIYGTDSGGFKLFFFATGANRISGTTVLSSGTWCHVAWCRDSLGDSRLFLNGTQEGSTYTDGTTYVGASGRPIIGANGNDTTSPLNGNIDSLIVSTIPLYTSNFSAPSAAYT
jgi:hypothetical protein